ncbi:PKD domain-containing protein [Agrococcus sediminis]|uniref:PKD domain-containing protein n=1 Tax=Agrococcus sediminis TaxID=2599924 RepID=UPI00342F810E
MRTSTPIRTLIRTHVAAVGAIAVGAAILVSAPSAAVAADPVIEPAALEASALPHEASMSADALPTVQIDQGVVWDVHVAGNIAYAGGQFSNARPAGAAPGTNLIPRSNFLAFDVQTGQVTSFAPSFNGRVNDIAVSPDGRRLYVVGAFTAVNGQTRNRIAVFDLPGHTLSTTVVPNINGTTQSVAATNSTVYVGGYFSAVNGSARARIGAVNASNGAVLPFRPIVDNGMVQALAVGPDATKVMLSGNFTSVAGGQSEPGYGLSMVDASTGAQLPLPVNSIVRNAGDNSGVTKLSTDGVNFYGVGWHYGRGGNMEGAFQARWSDGEMVWIEDCHGDTYDAAAVAGQVYMASHKHYCGNSGGFPQSDPWTFYHSTAVTTEVHGANTPDIYGYPDHPGRPRPEILNWYPQTDIGTFTGKNQAVWALDGNDQYLVYGGEFPRVNGATQQGLVRYTLRQNAPDNQGPRLSQDQDRLAIAAGITPNAWWTPSVSAVIPGSLRVSFPTIFDRDDQALTYRVYLDSETTAGLVGEQTMSNKFWDVQTVRTLISGLEPGSTHQVRVVARDPGGNVFRSEWATATVSSGAISAYLESVAQDDVVSMWRLGEASGSSVDLFGGSDMQLSGRMTYGEPGALASDADAAIRFNTATTNSQNDGSGGSTTRIAGPQRFSIETWFRTSTTSGGKLVGFGNARTGSSTSYDRHLYMNNAGQLLFGVYPGSVQVITTPGTYRDGEWHHAVATLGSEGMRLYVDGQLRAQRNDVTSAQAYQGYWRIANDNLNSWTSAPGSRQFEGLLDEVAIYDRPLSADRVQAHYEAGTTGVAPNTPPSAAIGTPSVDGLQVGFSGSATDADGTVVSYAWSFGDGSTGTGASVTKTYSTAGTYDVTLTVTDDDGATGTATTQVTVEPVPNAAPSASFTIQSQGLEVSVDGSSSSDPDGSVASYEWDFGAGFAAGAATASHEFGSAGTYPVRLRVTDDDGATDVDEQSVTVIEPGAGVLAQDGFDRTVSNGWGTADVGGPWSLRGTASRFSVADGEGRMTIPASTSQTVYADLNGVSSASTRIDAVFSVDSLVEAQYVSLVGRRVGSTNYIARLRLQADGGVRLYLLQDGATAIAPMLQVPITIVPGEQYAFSMEVTGTSPTTVRAKLWEVGQAEPGWMREGTNSLAALQTAGAVSVFTYVPNNPGGGAVAFDSITVSDPAGGAPAPNVAPTASFTSSSSGLVVSVDASGSSDPDGSIESYAWDFGSGFVEGGATATHEFSAAGSYPVRLRVTDDDGATATAERSITVAEPGAGVLAQDGFDRTVSNGWGTADVGGPWSLRGTASRFSVADGEGRMTIPASTSQTVYADLNGVSSASTRIDAVFSVDSLVEAQYVSLVGRRVGSTNYIARLRLQADGGVRLYLLQDGATAIAPMLQVPITIVPGEQYAFSMEVTGTSPTTVRAKLWEVGQAEPGWMREGTNSLAALQTAGAVSVFTYVPNNPGGGAVAFDSITVSDPALGG